MKWIASLSFYKQPKTYKELTLAERRSFDDQINFYNMAKQFKAAKLLGGISHAQDVIGQAK